MQWLKDVNEKVVLENGDPVPVLLLANKVRWWSFTLYKITINTCTV